LVSNGRISTGRFVLEGNIVTIRIYKTMKALNHKLRGSHRWMCQ
jgi:hypothetical protein